MAECGHDEERSVCECGWLVVEIVVCVRTVGSAKPLGFEGVVSWRAVGLPFRVLLLFRSGGCWRSFFVRHSSSSLGRLAGVLEVL